LELADNLDESVILPRNEQAWPKADRQVSGMKPGKLPSRKIQKAAVGAAPADVAYRDQKVAPSSRSAGRGAHYEN
jgi:hypothetical protein